MISYRFFILHAAHSFDLSFDSFFDAFNKMEGDIWTDNNLTGSFPHLIIEEKDDTGQLNRRIIFKSSSEEEGYPEIREASEEWDALIGSVRSGTFRSYPEIKDSSSMQISFIRLETEEPGDRKIFISIVEKILVELRGIVVHPEIMRLSDFRSFFSLQRDVVEEEKEPEDFQE